LIEWMREARSDLAAVLAEVLSSTEALSLSGDAEVDPAAAREVGAAADVAVRVLESVAGSYDTAQELLAGSTGLSTVRRG
jgi:hypothetical protein